MASVQILCPNGHRQTVKVNPNTKILQVLEEVCMKKGFMPPEDYELRHGRTTLDVTLSVRYANLVSNAKLELVKSQKSRAETTVVIALQLSTGERLQHDFNPAVTLWDLLLHWENQPNSAHQGKFAACQGDQHPVCIYMRDEVIGEDALKATTLRKLGLTKGKAIIRLLHRKVEEETLREIQRQLAAEKAKQDKLVARSISHESMSTETQANVQTISEPTQAKSTVKEQSSDGQPLGKSIQSSERSQDIPMETEAGATSSNAGPESEQMDVATVSSSSSESNMNQRTNGETERKKTDTLHSDIFNIPGVQVFRPGERVQLSADQQQFVDSISRVIRPHIHRGPPAPFKFPEETKGQDLYSNEFSDGNKNTYKPCDRETVVYSLDEPVDHDPSYTDELPDEFFEVTETDIKKLIADKARALNSLEQEPLMTKSMRQAILEEKLSKYERVVIRVQFPDRMVLQGLFRPKETVHNVEKFVKDHLENKGEGLYLYTAPPKCVLKDKTSTLLEANLVPASVVYCGTKSETGGPFLSAALHKECSTRRAADEIVLKSFPKSSEPSTPSENPAPSSSKKGGQPKRSNPSPVDYPSRDKSDAGKEGDGKKVPKWFAAGMKK